MVDQRLRVSYRSPRMGTNFRIALIYFGCLISVGWTVPRMSMDTTMGYACSAENRRYHGGFFELGSNITLAESLHLRARYNLAEFRSKGEAFTTHGAALGAVFDLDVFHYVPWAGITANSYFSQGPMHGDSPEFGVSLELGFDRLLDRHWAIGFASQFHQVFSNERFPAYMLLGIRIIYRRSVGDPFEP
jgi:hypothetical protein